MSPPPIQRYGDGVLLYEPLYSYVEKVADLLSTVESIPISLKIEDAALMALNDVFEDITINLGERFGIVLSITGLTYLVVKRLAGKLYRGVRQDIGPIEMEIAMFPDADTDHEDGMIGQIISAKVTH